MHFQLNDQNTRSYIATRFSTWIGWSDEEDSASQEDRITAILQYCIARGTLDISDAEAERCVWMVNQIFDMMSAWQEVKNGKLFMAFGLTFDQLERTCSDLAPETFLPTQIPDVLPVIEAKASLLNAVEQGPRISRRNTLGVA